MSQNDDQLENKENLVEENAEVMETSSEITEKNINETNINSEEVKESDNLEKSADSTTAEKPEESVESDKNKNQPKEKKVHKNKPIKSQKKSKSENNEKKSEKKSEKKEFHIRTSFVKNYEKLQSNMPVLIISCVSSFIIMGFLAVVIFFSNVKGPEKVLVPNVVGKTLEDALLEMQVKELYPKINLRYSDTPGDNGTILEQTPDAGAIVKGYSRVSLVVSRGVLVDSVGEYVGQPLDEVILKLEALFAGQQTPLIKLDPPEYKPDTSPAGTILEQNPPAGTSIYEPISVQLVVSRGPNYENTRAPNVMGQSVNDLLQTITRSKIIFEITAHEATKEEVPGTVVSQEKIDSEFVPNYTRVNVEMAMPKKPINDNYYGIFTKNLVEYPYPVPMKLTAVPEEGESYTMLEFSHTGGKLTIPYAVPRGTTLILTVAEKVQGEEVIN